MENKLQSSQEHRRVHFCSLDQCVPCSLLRSLSQTLAPRAEPTLRLALLPRSSKPALHPSQTHFGIFLDLVGFNYLIAHYFYVVVLFEACTGGTSWCWTLEKQPHGFLGFRRTACRW